MLYCCLVLAGFAHFSHLQSDSWQQLVERKEELLAQKQQLLLFTAELREQVRHQSSAAWIEQRLMGRLGLVPKGMRKVVFLPEQRTP